MKSFSKTGLKVGDRVKSPRDSCAYSVVEVCGSIFAISNDTGEVAWYTYKRAENYGWIILEDEQQKDNVHLDLSDIQKSQKKRACYRTEMGTDCYCGKCNRRYGNLKDEPKENKQNLLKRMSDVLDTMKSQSPTTTLEKYVNERIIKNNNELIEEIKKHNKSYYLNTALDIIQSKNDSLSKE